MAKVTGTHRQVVDFENVDDNRAVDANDEVTFVEVTYFDDGTTQLQRKTVTVDTYLNTVIEEANKKFTVDQKKGQKEARGQAILKPLADAQVQIDRIATRLFGDDFSFTGVKADDPIDGGDPIEKGTASREDYDRRLLRAAFAAEMGDPKAFDRIEELRAWGHRADVDPSEVQEDIRGLYDRLLGDSNKRAFASSESSFWGSVAQVLPFGLSEEELSLSDAAMLIQGITVLLLNPESVGA